MQGKSNVLFFGQKKYEKWIYREKKVIWSESEISDGKGKNQGQTTQKVRKRGRERIRPCVVKLAGMECIYQNGYKIQL